LSRLANRSPHRRRKLSEIDLTAAIAEEICPLSPEEITQWASCLGQAGVDGERKLNNLVTYWFAHARSFSRQTQETDPTRVSRQIERVDKRLSKLANRLSSLHADLLALPKGVNAALEVRFDEYSNALDYLALLPVMLIEIAQAWHRPRAGQPSFEMHSYAIELLIRSIVDFTGNEFPSPRSYKRTAEIDFLRMLAHKLFPASTRPQIDTMLRHFHKRRLDKGPVGRRRGGKPAAEYSRS
jgi:hypothetical protein